jgi:hypothetical protein
MYYPPIPLLSRSCPVARPLCWNVYQKIPLVNFSTPHLRRHGAVCAWACVDAKTMSELSVLRARPCGSTRLRNNGTLPAGPRPRAEDRLILTHIPDLDPRPSCRAEPSWLPDPSRNVPLRHRDDGLLSAILGEASLEEGGVRDSNACSTTTREMTASTYTCAIRTRTRRPSSKRFFQGVTPA